MAELLAAIATDILSQKTPTIIAGVQVNPAELAANIESLVCSPRADADPPSPAECDPCVLAAALCRTWKEHHARAVS